MSENLSLQEEADFKFGKLCEIVQDIEINGQDGDQFPRQIILRSIVASKNEILWNKLEETLFEENRSELMRTVLVGLLMQNGNMLPLCEYAKNMLNGISVLNEDFEDKESLILIADFLVKGTHSEDESLRNRSCELLLTLYKASCHAKSSAIIADQLLQRFINMLPNKSKIIDDNLLLLIKNIEAEINSRVISIEILSKSQPVEFFETASVLISDLENYSKNAIEKIYLLDVLTKYIFNVAASSLVINYSSLSQNLCDIDMTKILEYAKAENGSENSEQFDVIHKRIVRRIFQLNELVNEHN